LIIKQIDATGSGVGKFHPAPNSREYLFFSLNYLSKGLKELSSRQKLREPSLLLDYKERGKIEKKN